MRSAENGHATTLEVAPYDLWRCGPHATLRKRVDDYSRFYGNFRDVRGARVSTLTPYVLKPNADPVALT